MELDQSNKIAVVLRGRNGKQISKINNLESIKCDVHQFIYMELNQSNKIDVNVRSRDGNTSQ